jgi:single-strand DNA-binding protein
MYDNTVRLIGFLGKDAEVKSTKSGNEYTVLSLATQASWKDKKSGEYVNRTEWHRMIAWANLSTFAATLKKGTHLSVEGELRYREFNDKKHKKVKVRLAEIHLGKIGKLDRAEKRDANAAPPDLPTNGDEAPFYGPPCFLLCSSPPCVAVALRFGKSAQANPKYECSAAFRGLVVALVYSRVQATLPMPVGDHWNLFDRPRKIGGVFPWP